MLSREEKKGYRWIRLEARIADRGEKSLVTFAVLRIKKDAAIIAIGILADIYIYTWNCKMGEGTGSKSRYEAHWVAVYCDSYTSHPSSFRGGIYQRHRS